VPGIASLRHNADAIVQRLDFNLVPLAMGCVLGVFAKGTHVFAVFVRLTFRLTIYEQRWASSLSPAVPPQYGQTA
jgi:hypothetical protein